MASHPATGVARRLAARLRTEPLQVPMPPPARPGQRTSKPASWSRRADCPSDPPAPPSILHREGSDSSTRIEPELGERSLTSLPVIGSIIASLLIMGTIACIRVYGSHGLSWATVKQALQQWKAKTEVVEDDLPYVTSMPLVPGASGVESTATAEQPPPQPAKRIVLGNPLRNDRPKDANEKSNERR